MDDRRLLAIHQCPMCALRFRYRPVLESHLREEHPSFRCDYPVAHPRLADDWPFEVDDGLKSVGDAG
jgi:hypothetical protein